MGGGEPDAADRVDDGLGGGSGAELGLGSGWGLGATGVVEVAAGDDRIGVAESDLAGDAVNGSGGVVGDPSMVLDV